MNVNDKISQQKMITDRKRWIWNKIENKLEENKYQMPKTSKNQLE